MTLAPQDPAARDQTLDVLHGAALLFVLLVDVHYYHNSLFAALSPPLNPVLTGSDRAAALLVDAFAFMKGLMLFAFLFGVSLAIIAERAGAEFERLYTRRLAGLALLGALHGALVWYGGQLIVLSVVGTAAALLARREARALLRLAAWLFAAGLLAAAAAVLAADLTGSAAAMTRRFAYLAGWEDAAYSTGTFWWAARVRLEMAAGFVPLQLGANGLRMLAAALAGAAAHRLGLFRDPAAWTPRLRAGTAACLSSGTALTALALAFDEGRSLVPARALIGGGSLYIGSALLAAGYAGTLTLLMQAPRVRSLLAPVRDAGRMALTNFILSSLCFSLMAYPYGLGLYGRVGRWELAAAALALYAALCLFSVLWLRRFRFGPFEWVLRGWVYGRLPALEIRAGMG